MVRHISLFIILSLWKQGVPVLPIHRLCSQQMCSPQNAPIATAVDVTTEETQVTGDGAIKLMTSRLCHEP